MAYTYSFEFFNVARKVHDVVFNNCNVSDQSLSLVHVEAWTDFDNLFHPTEVFYLSSPCSRVLCTLWMRCRNVSQTLSSLLLRISGITTLLIAIPPEIWVSFPSWIVCL